MKENGYTFNGESAIESVGKKIEQLRGFLFEIGRPPEKIELAIARYKKAALEDPVTIIQCCDVLMGLVAPEQEIDVTTLEGRRIQNEKLTPPNEKRKKENRDRSSDERLRRKKDGKSRF